MMRDVPKRYQAAYSRAMSGKSRKAAMYSFCLECVGYEIREVYLCTDPGCPLYPYRPGQRSKVGRHAPESRQTPCNAVQNGAESTKSPKAGKCTPGEES